MTKKKITGKSSGSASKSGKNDMGSPVISQEEDMSSPEDHNVTLRSFTCDRCGEEQIVPVNGHPERCEICKGNRFAKISNINLNYGGK